MLCKFSKEYFLNAILKEENSIFNLIKHIYVSPIAGMLTRHPIEKQRNTFPYT